MICAGPLRMAWIACCATLMLGSCAGLHPTPSRAPDAPYISTRTEVVQGMLQLGKVTNTDIVYDLGCGDGRIVIAAARDYGARGVGIDLDPARIGQANANARSAGVSDRVTFIVGDLFQADISQATVVMIYLGQGVNRKLKPKLLRELKPGTRLVSHQFDMGSDWPPEQRIQVGKSIVYLWTIP